MGSALVIGGSFLKLSGVADTTWGSYWALLAKAALKALPTTKIMPCKFDTLNGITAITSLLLFLSLGTDGGEMVTTSQKRIALLR